MKPDPTDYIRLIKAALALTPAKTAEARAERETLYNQAALEAARLESAGMTVAERRALVEKETGRNV